MFSIALFRKSSKRSPVKHYPNARAAFSACVRAEADYSPAALTHALGWADVTEYPVTLCGLRAAYNDYRFAIAGFASRRSA